MRNLGACLVVVGLLTTVAAVAQTPDLTAAAYRDTDYVSGKAGFDRKMKGQLVIDSNALVFNDKNGTEVFTIPMETVITATSEVETDPGGFGRRAVLGVFASKREEFLTVTVQTAAGSEAIVFKGRKKTTADMVAKIRFHQKRLAT